MRILYFSTHCLHVKSTIILVSKCPVSSSTPTNSLRAVSSFTFLLWDIVITSKSEIEHIWSCVSTI
jgi:hypothetical protein